MSRSRVLRCAACAGRIKPHHPHIGVEDLTTGKEFSYHARVGCQIRAAEETATRLEAGSVYAMHHYHSSTCPDEVPGWGCAGGCFDSPAMVTN
ncbi:MAG: hypothetical protein M3522_01505 [Actinomycetota bacterium]|jgi:uncharacterized protein YjlB|nr:hypothetical protein [Actinomycetota bacterium]